MDRLDSSNTRRSARAARTHWPVANFFALLESVPGTFEVDIELKVGISL